MQIRLRAEDNGKPLRVKVGGRLLFDERLLYTQGEAEYVREIGIPAEIASSAAQKPAGGKTHRVLPVRFEGAESEPSARVCGFIRIYAE